MTRRRLLPGGGTGCRLQDATLTELVTELAAELAAELGSYGVTPRLKDTVHKLLRGPRFVLRGMRLHWMWGHLPGSKAV